MLGAQVRVLGFQVGCRALEKDGQEPRGRVLEVDHYQRSHPGEHSLGVPVTEFTRTERSDSDRPVAGHHPAIPARQRGTDVKDDPLDQRNVSTLHSSHKPRRSSSNLTLLDLAGLSGASWSKYGRSPKSSTSSTTLPPRARLSRPSRSRTRRSSARMRSGRGSMTRWPLGSSGPWRFRS